VHSVIKRRFGPGLIAAAAFGMPNAAEASGSSSGCTMVKMDNVGPAYGSDVIPSNFETARIDDAWARGATGQGVTVAVVDTGIGPDQAQLGSHFATQDSQGRTIGHINVGAGTADTCGHGTRAAGTIAAPNDDANIVGVAWRANLLNVKIGNGVVLDSAKAKAVADGLRAAIVGRARPRIAGIPGGNERMVVSMAIGDYPLFGIWGEYERLQRTIEELHRDYDVLIVGAAGSVVCTMDNTIAFPARLPQVLAVTAASDEHTVHSTGCGGPEVDLAVPLHECPEGQWGDLCKSVPTTGWYESDFATFGASSDATSVMSGIAALVWSQHPGWTRDQVRARLIESGSLYPINDGNLGKGLIDAWKAAGGFAGLSIAVPSTIQPYSSFRLTARPRGDGPFRYAWNTGETTQSITRVEGAAGTKQTATVTVTDVSDGTSRTATLSAGAPPPPPETELPTICDRYPWKCE
jgi:subtilisin family serine protease